ncbi:hypothetical protein [Nonomuraea sp. NPDC050643]|uniref:hypothetical protein n=1 Tax=Nonomuraea sp. NPDC050643 TaxID=3155660 RepID=UPI0033FB126D
MIGNITAELVPYDAEAREIVARSHARFTQIVADALRRAQAGGEVTQAATPEAQAQLLLFTVQGLPWSPAPGSTPLPHSLPSTP